MMHDRVSDEMVKKSVARLPKHYGLSTVREDGELYVSNPYPVMVTTPTGLRGVAIRHRPLNSANDTSELRKIIQHRLHCRQLTGKHHLEEARAERRRLLEADKEARIYATREHLAKVLN